MLRQSVCAIDVGYRNFAYCFVNPSNWRQPLQWAHEDLWAPQPGRRQRPQEQDLVQIMWEWCQRHRLMLEQCDCIVLERQMRTNFKLMNTVVQALFYGKVVQVHPMTVGTFWNLPKTRDAKKAAGINVVTHNGARFPNGRKLDDMADAWLMALYQMVQYDVVKRNELYFLPKQ